jgi:hypothetical protein
MLTPELNFEECSECKKKFHSNVELKVHMKLMHPKVDEFNCNICDKKFKRKWTLRVVIFSLFDRDSPAQTTTLADPYRSIAINFGPKTTLCRLV